MSDYYATSKPPADSFFPLFDSPPSVPVATSRAAAKKIAPHSGKLAAQVLAYLQRRGEHGATDEEISRDTGLSPSTARPRRLELVRRGLVKRSGRTRPGVSGCKMTVWIVAASLRALDSVTSTSLPT
jgi:hypothetical protein